MAEVVEVEASLLITPEQVEEAVALVPQVHQVGQVPLWGPVGTLLSRVPVKGILLVVVEPKAAQVTVELMPAQESVPSTAVVAAAAVM
jgi:hypothetical protein